LKLRLGDYTLDADTRQLLRGDREVHLSPKAFDLLSALVEARPKALSKARLHERLWPSTFVSDANLAVLIGEVRRALGDEADAPRFIRTVHRFGYAFCGVVAESTGSPAAVMTSSPTYWLVWNNRKFALAAGENLVGRDPRSSVWLDLPGVSRHHARIAIGGDDTTLEDLGSKNGTFLGETEVTGRSPLKDEDVIRIGPAKMTFRIWREPASTETGSRTGVKRRPGSRRR
jgi:DNA-binding winged helix-turn-helix (wHTH) protein